MKKTITKVSPVISKNVNDASIPGVQVQLSLEEAENYGVFLETALSEEDAWESNVIEPLEDGIVVETEE